MMKLAKMLLMWGPQNAIVALGLVGLGLTFSASADTNVKYTYDLSGRVTTAIYDNGTCIAYTYDANGNRLSQIGTMVSTSSSLVWGAGKWGCQPWGTASS